MKNKIYPREKYLSKIRPFYDSDIVKVITGIRRSGKSFILKSVIKELESRNLSNRIIYLPLDKRGFKNITTPEQLEDKIEEQIKDSDMYYLIIDEVQNVKGFEKVILQYEEEGYSIFLTGSNSYLLSDEISTKLTGRYISFETYPLDFSEYLEMKKFFKKKINDNIYEEFNSYIIEGGFPKAIEFDDLSSKQLYTKEIIKEIINKDVKTRNKIKNKALFERVQSYIINNYTSPFSLKVFYNSLVDAGINVKLTTIKNYIEILKKAKIVYECNRFDLKSKKSLLRDQKYYLADMALYFSTNVDNNLNYGPSLENIVYLYLVSNGYQVSVGRIGNFECDFIVRKQNGDYAYIQVAYTITGNEKVKEREYRPFREIRDGYPRYIISLDVLRDQQEGVHHINAIDLFLGKVII
ncbi:MAG: ATP-binding protein [Bacilli bacterium]|nr:ATP-binding protein [Bacillales bacterium]MDY2574703.1 ATP-binding protein [Bacilli bacterium]